MLEEIIKAIVVASIVGLIGWILKKVWSHLRKDRSFVVQELNQNIGPNDAPSMFLREEP